MNEIEAIEKLVKKYFIARIVLWLIAVAATAYWIVWSFLLYEQGFYDPYEYAGMLRPKMTVGLLIALVSLGISYLLRRTSDKHKAGIKHAVG